LQYELRRSASRAETQNEDGISQREGVLLLQGREAVGGFRLRQKLSRQCNQKVQGLPEGCGGKPKKQPSQEKPEPFPGHALPQKVWNHLRRI
jgi:hypothetical protein